MEELKQEEAQQRCALTTEERDSIIPTLARMAQYQSLLEEAAKTLQPVILLLARQHGVSLQEYSLAPDGTAFVLRES